MQEWYAEGNSESLSVHRLTIFIAECLPLMGKLIKAVTCYSDLALDCGGP